MNWFSRNSNALQALAGLVTVFVAVVALIGVKFQVDASYRVQREQSAKEIYRELLNISIANPDYAAPDYCALKATPKLAGYEAFVDYVLYTAEQVIDMDPEWGTTVEQLLDAHAGHLCSDAAAGDNSPAVAAMLKSFKSRACKTVSPC